MTARHLMFAAGVLLLSIRLLTAQNSVQYVTAGGSGVSTNQLVTESAGAFIPAPASYTPTDCGDGFAVAGAASTNAFPMSTGAASIQTGIADGTIATGSYVTVSATISGDVTSAGSSRAAISPTKCVVGVALTSTGSGGGIITILYDGPGSFGGGNAGASSIGGSIAGIAFNISAGGLTPFGISTGSATVACAATTVTFVSGSGYLRNLTVTTQTAVPNSGPATIGASPNCGSTSGFSTGVGAVFLPPGSPAGIYTDSISSAHIATFEGFGLAYNAGHTGVGAPTINGATMEFVADSGAMTTMLAGAPGATPTASATTFCSFAGSCGTPEQKYATPMPFAGTLSTLTYGQHIQPSNGIMVFVNDNTSNSLITVTPGSGDPTSMGYYDGNVSHAKTVSAGDYIDLAITTGAGTQSIVNGYSLNLMPTSGAPFMIYGGIESTSLSTSTAYYSPFGNQTSGTESFAQIALPRTCPNATNLWVTITGAQTAGVTTTFTLNKNSSASSVIGTLTTTNGTAAGSVQIYSGTGTTFNAGDLMDLKVSSTGGTSVTLGHWAIQCGS